MSEESSQFDMILRRTKDFTLLAMALFAFFIGNGVKFYGLPERVNAQAQTLQELRKSDEMIGLRLQAQEINTAYISKSLDEIKLYMRATLREVKGTYKEES